MTPYRPLANHDRPWLARNQGKKIMVDVWPLHEGLTALLLLLHTSAVNDGGDYDDDVIREIQTAKFMSNHPLKQGQLYPVRSKRG